MAFGVRLARSPLHSILIAITLLTFGVIVRASPVIGSVLVESEWSSTATVTPDPTYASAAAAGGGSATLFVGPNGVLLSAPLSLEGTDVGVALAELRADVVALREEAASQARRIVTLEPNLVQTNALVTSQGLTIATLTAQMAAVNATVTNISDLTSETTIVVVVNGLRRRADQLTTDVTLLGDTLANQTAALALLHSAVSDIDSLTGDSLIVQTVHSLSTTTAGSTTTVDAISSLTGSSTLVTTVLSLMDSMTDLATDISQLQTLQTATT